MNWTRIIAGRATALLLQPWLSPPLHKPLPPNPKPKTSAAASSERGLVEKRRPL